MTAEEAAEIGYRIGLNRGELKALIDEGRIQLKMKKSAARQIEKAEDLLGLIASDMRILSPTKHNLRRPGG